MFKINMSTEEETSSDLASSELDEEISFTDDEEETHCYTCEPKFTIEELEQKGIKIDEQTQENKQTNKQKTQLLTKEESIA